MNLGERKKGTLLVPGNHLLYVEIIRRTTKVPDILLCCAVAERLLLWGGLSIIEKCLEKRTVSNISLDVELVNQGVEWQSVVCQCRVSLITSFLDGLSKRLLLDRPESQGKEVQKQPHYPHGTFFGPVGVRDSNAYIFRIQEPEQQRFHRGQEKVEWCARVLAGERHDLEA